MPWITGNRPRSSAFTASAAIASVWPVAAALAAEQTRIVDPTLLPWATWFWVVLLALLGWAASSLPALAGWVDGTLAERLKVVQGVIASLLAGMIAFLLGRYFEAANILSFIGAAGGGFLGDKYLQPMFTRVLAAVWPVNSEGKQP